MNAAWERAGGDRERLAFYRSFMPVTPLADDSGRALVFDNGAIGDFTGGPTLLAAAEGVLRARGVREAVGPLDGNTFLAYRCNLGPFVVPAFPGEPTAAAEVWRAAGWREDARYTSNWCANAPQIAAAKPLPPGWRCRPLEPDRFEDELHALYRVTLAAFAEAWRYAPIPFAAFAALYAPYRGRIDPRWVLLGEDPSGVVQGYLFAFPIPGAFVLKTLAVHPEARGVRLARHLVVRIHGFAEEQGIPGAIHALMWEGSLSTGMSAHGGEIIRRYALYRKCL